MALSICLAWAWGNDPLKVCGARKVDCSSPSPQMLLNAFVAFMFYKVLLLEILETTLFKATQLWKPTTSKFCSQVQHGCSQHTLCTEPLPQEAAAIIHFTMQVQSTRRLDLQDILTALQTPLALETVGIPKRHGGHLSCNPPPQKVGYSFPPLSLPPSSHPDTFLWKANKLNFGYAACW